MSVSSTPSSTSASTTSSRSSSQIAPVSSGRSSRHQTNIVAPPGGPSVPDITEEKSAMPSQTLFVDTNGSISVQSWVEMECSKKNIKKVASFVSAIYAKFPRLSNAEREALRKRGFCFHPRVYETPSASECAQFRSALKKRIITALNQKEEIGLPSIKLSTDYWPEDMLRDLAKSAFPRIYQLGQLFPCKTDTTISLKERGTKLELDMNFQGPPV